MTYSILVEREEGGREREVRESREGGMDVLVDSDCWGVKLQKKELREGWKVS